MLQTLYAYYATPEKSISQSQQELFFSLGKSYDLYHLLLLLIIDLSDFARKRIENNLNKHRPNKEDLQPNRKFTENKLIEQLRINRRLQSYLHQTKISWAQHPELIKEMLGYVTDSVVYAEYMQDKENSYYADKIFVEKLLNEVILSAEDLHLVLEEDSIYWNDDIDLVVAMVVKTLRGFNKESDENQPLMELFKDDDDRQFARDLLRLVAEHHDDLRSIIDLHASNWDIERIAFMDILIMQLALTEFIYFPTIPTKVTLNEYIELAKYYSTDKSRNFINGILDKALKELRQEDKVHKTGRGLIGEQN